MGLLLGFLPRHNAETKGRQVSALVSSSFKIWQVNAASPPPSIERDKEDRGIARVRGRDRESMRIYFRAYMYSLGNDLMCFGSPDRQQSIISVG